MHSALGSSASPELSSATCCFTTENPKVRRVNFLQNNSQGRMLPIRLRVLLSTLGIGLFAGSIAMIEAENRWGVLIGILGAITITGAFQNYRTRPSER